MQGELIRYRDRVRHQGNRFSDHDGVRFRMLVGREEVGGGMWILNKGCLEELEYERQMRQLLDLEDERLKRERGRE